MLSRYVSLMKSVVKKWIFITEHVWRGGCHVADRIYSCQPFGNFHHFVSTSRSSMLDPANSVTFLTSIFQFNFWIIKCVLIVVVVGVTCREYAGVVLWAIKSFKNIMCPSHERSVGSVAESTSPVAGRPAGLNKLPSRRIWTHHKHAD